MRPQAESPLPTGQDRRPAAARRVGRGLLLVEAVLSAAVIGLGLVFISRSFSGHLRALKTMEATDVLLSLSRSLLAEVEAARAASQPTARSGEGTFEAPHEAYGWQITAAPQGAAGGVPVSQVNFAVHPVEGAGPQVRLWALWPSEWVPDSW